jgi:hypothetical protein
MLSTRRSHLPAALTEHANGQRRQQAVVGEERGILAALGIAVSDATQECRIGTAGREVVEGDGLIAEQPRKVIGAVQPPRVGVVPGTGDEDRVQLDHRFVRANRCPRVDKPTQVNQIDGRSLVGQLREGHHAKVFGAREPARAPIPSYRAAMRCKVFQRTNSMTCANSVLLTCMSPRLRYQ